MGLPGLVGEEVGTYFGTCGFILGNSGVGVTSGPPALSAHFMPLNCALKAG